MIGGSVAILGQPTRVAFDTSAQLRGTLPLVAPPRTHQTLPRDSGWPGAGIWSWRKGGAHPAVRAPRRPDMVAIIGAGFASSRAAVMLSAAGVPWTNAGMPIGISIAQSEPRGRGRRVQDPFAAPWQLEEADDVGTG